MALQTEREKTAHLLRRFGLGASEAELDYYGEGGHKKAIDRLLDFEKVEEGFDIPIEAFAVNQNFVNLRGLQMWWALRLVGTRRPLQEKLTLFWHDHFATSAAKVDVAPAMHAQNEVLRQHCAGRFQTLLTEASKDPAMLYWLDNQFNVKGKPNENFAREVMELFTLGIGHYTEEDIQEAARAFTGWTFGVGPRGQRAQKPFRRARFVFRQADHDDGEKAILGSKGKFDGDDVLGLLCGQPRTAAYISLKMWEWFAYPKPEPAIVDRIAKRFRESGLEIKVLVRAIMESPEFYSSKAERAIVKSPVDFCVSTYRQLGIGERLVGTFKENIEDPQRLRAIGPVNAVMTSTKAMGMELFFPPDVDGWPHGADWISSATMVERIKWADRLFGAGGRGAPARVPVFDLVGEERMPSGVVQKLCSVFDAQLTASKVRQLEDAAHAVGSEVTPRNAGAIASAVCRLLFGSPEFQFC